MRKRWFDYVTSAMIVISVLFLVSFVLATHTTLFTAQGSLLNQGYVGENGGTNLNNIAVGALIALVVSVVLNRLLVSKQSKETRFIRKAGGIVLILTGLWFLIFIAAVTYLLISGRFLEGWQF
jgi:magnesium-transporting ATPase (P-type)